jgi:hypothetical protein
VQEHFFSFFFTQRIDPCSVSPSPLIPEHCLILRMSWIYVNTMRNPCALREKGEEKPTGFLSSLALSLSPYSLVALLSLSPSPPSCDLIDSVLFCVSRRSLCNEESLKTLDSSNSSSESFLGGRGCASPEKREGNLTYRTADCVPSSYRSYVHACIHT